MGNKDENENIISNNIIRNMYIGFNELEIEEIIYNDPTQKDSQQNPINLQTNILYYTIPNEDFAGLIRKVTFTNLDHNNDLYLDGLDGLAELIPYGLNNGDLDAMFRTREAWMHVYNTETEIYQNIQTSNKQNNEEFNITTIPYYHISQSTEDSMNVNIIKNGHFVVSYFEENTDQLLPIIYDPAIIFGSMDSDMLHPISPFNSAERMVEKKTKISSKKLREKNYKNRKSRINEILARKQVLLLLLLSLL